MKYDAGIAVRKKSIARMFIIVNIKKQIVLNNGFQFVRRGQLHAIVLFLQIK